MLCSGGLKKNAFQAWTCPTFSVSHLCEGAQNPSLLTAQHSIFQFNGKFGLLLMFIHEVFRVLIGRISLKIRMSCILWIQSVCCPHHKSEPLIENLTFSFICANFKQGNSDINTGTGAWIIPSPTVRLLVYLNLGIRWELKTFVCLL